MRVQPFLYSKRVLANAKYLFFRMRELERPSAKQTFVGEPNFYGLGSDWTITTPAIKIHSAGQSGLSLFLRNFPRSETPVFRWNILGRNNLNMRYGCIKRIGHELVMMQEGLEHVL